MDEAVEETSTVISLKRAASAAPALNVGSMRALEAPKKKAKSAPRRKKDVGDEEGIVEVSTGTSEDPLVMQDLKLKSIADSLGYVPVCFSGLVISRTLEAKEKPGHQLKGVGGCQKFSLHNTVLFKV